MTVTCPSCGKELPADASFCSGCGTKLTAGKTVERTTDYTKTQGQNREWARTPGDFAQRFEILDLKGIFSKKFTVEQGERAIFLEGGVYKGALSAGVYTFGGIFSEFKIQNFASLIIVDAGTVPVYFQIPNLKTKNAVTVSASGKVTAQIKDFPAFLENYLKHEGHVSLTDIEKYVSDELKYAAQNIIGDYTAEELIGNAALVSQLDGEFRHLLSYGFRNRGIEILGVSCIGFDEGAWKQVTAEREKLSVEVGKARAEYERKAAVRALENADAVDAINGKAAVNQAQHIRAVKKQLRQVEKELAKLFDEKLFGAVISRATEQLNKSNFHKACIYARAALLLENDDVNAMYLYACCCREWYLSLEGEEEGEADGQQRDDHHVPHGHLNLLAAFNLVDVHGQTSFTWTATCEGPA